MVNDSSWPYNGCYLWSLVVMGLLHGVGLSCVVPIGIQGIADELLRLEVISPYRPHFKCVLIF